MPTAKKAVCFSLYTVPNWLKSLKSGQSSTFYAGLFVNIAGHLIHLPPIKSLHGKIGKIMLIL